MKMIILIPAFNEEDTIVRTIENISTSFEGIDQVSMLVVDDGSTDATPLLAEKAGAVVISHTRNRGVGSAFHTAVQYALENQADILVGIDADGQFDPNEIPALIAPILSREADMVIGNRFSNGIPEHMPRIKYHGNRIVARLVNSIAELSLADVSCGFRAYDVEALLRLNIYGEFTYTHETILSAVYQGLKVVEHPISVRYDPKRRSRVADSVFKYGVQTSKIILRVLLDYRPLRVFGTIGGVLIGLGVAMVLFLFGHYILTGSFTPYKTVGFVSLGFFIFGMLTLIIALIADMLNRMKRNQDKILVEVKRMHYRR